MKKASQATTVGNNDIREPGNDSGSEAMESPTRQSSSE